MHWMVRMSENGPSTRQIKFHLILHNIFFVLRERKRILQWPLSSLVEKQHSPQFLLKLSSKNSHDKGGKQRNDDWARGINLLYNDVWLVWMNQPKRPPTFNLSPVMLIQPPGSPRSSSALIYPWPLEAKDSMFLRAESCLITHIISRLWQNLNSRDSILRLMMDVRPRSSRIKGNLLFVYLPAKVSSCPLTEVNASTFSRRIKRLIWFNFLRCVWAPGR